MTRPWLMLAAALKASALVAATPTVASPNALATYATHCAACHGVALSGSPMAPALNGPEFAFGWKNKSVDDLTDYIKANMPPGRAGSLTDQQYHDLALVLRAANQ